MTEPTIAGLTERQKSIADLIWTCNTEATLVQLIKSLPTEQDRQDATSLVKIMIHECVEQEQGLDDYLSAAMDAIEAARG
jgi:hypothetical protein